jgi:hypothetical protein
MIPALLGDNRVRSLDISPGKIVADWDLGSLYLICTVVIGDCFREILINKNQ